MTKDFDQIPVDSETTILLSTEVTFGETISMFQAWVWDGIQGNSLIFHAGDVENFNDEELKFWINSQSEIVQSKSSMNVSRNPYKHDYVVVNFDFKAMD